MQNRDIKNGNFGWYEKWAMKAIEDNLPFKQQLSCKGIYIALCSISAEQKNSPEIFCHRQKIATYASCDERTIRRRIPSLELLGIIKLFKQDRLSDGRYGLMKVQMLSPTGNLSNICPTSVQQVSDVYKKERKKEKKGIVNSNKLEDIVVFFNNTCSTNLKLTPAKKIQLNARLKRYSMEEIQTAISARVTMPFYAGENKDSKLWYKDWNSLFRNDEKIEAILNSGVKPAKTTEERVIESATKVLNQL